MRHIGSVPNEAQARQLGDFLHSRGIRNELEAERDNTWSVWIRDEDHVPEAQAILARFKADPNGTEFQNAAEAAAKARRAEAEDLEKYRQRVRSRRSIFPKFGNHGIGLLTFILMVVCGYVAVYSRLGDNHEWLRNWLITDPENFNGRDLSEVARGEFWRLFTPIFIHFGIVHLVFNMLWFYQLGSMIEARKGSLLLFAFIAVSALLSNVAEYFHHHYPIFGGMSGVVYALAGYVWIQGKYNRASGLYLDPQSVTTLLIWLVVCYTGILGHIANTAHLVGLLTGMLWGRIAAYFAMRNPE
jgi:GlpG protein